MTRLALLLFTFFMLPIQIAFAEETQTYQGPNMGLELLKLVFYLSLILAMIYLSLRFIAKKNGVMRPNIFQLLGGVQLGQNKSVQLVEIGNKIYILGVGQEVRLLQVIDSQEELEEIRDSMKMTSPANDRLIEWAQQLKDSSFINRFIKKKDQLEKEKKNDFETLLNQKMTQLKDQRAQSLQQILDTSGDTFLENLEKRDSDE